MFGTKTIFAAVCAMALAAPAGAATFNAEFWDVDTGNVGDPANNIIDNLGDALSIVEGANARAADATFQSSGIDYPTGPQGPGGTADTLASWLGADSATLSGLGSVSMLGTIIRFTGSIFVDAGLNNFTVGVDDGFRLTIDGTEVGSFGGTKAFTTYNTAFNNLGAAGAKTFELIFYEDNQVAVGVEFRKDGNVVAPVPLPAGAVLLLGALGLMGAARSRRKAA
jgi:hypothetical protein